MLPALRGREPLPPQSQSQSIPALNLKPSPVPADAQTKEDATPDVEEKADAENANGGNSNVKRVSV